eukprot:5677684-Prymnesium_polylepis.1
MLPRSIHDGRKTAPSRSFGDSTECGQSFPGVDQVGRSNLQYLSFATVPPSGVPTIRVHALAIFGVPPDVH